VQDQPTPDFEDRSNLDCPPQNPVEFQQSNHRQQQKSKSLACWAVPNVFDQISGKA
jgi:hypothetical protein